MDILNSTTARLEQRAGDIWDGLVAYWRLEDTTDVFGNNNLTNVGSVSFAGSGVSNKCAGSFNGTTQVLSKTNCTLSPTVGGWTLSFWINTANRAAPFMGVVNSAISTGNWYVAGDGTLLTFAIGDGAGAYPSIAFLAFPVSAWHHVVCWYNSSDRKAHVASDGVEGTAGSAIAALTTSYPARSLAFGGFADAAGAFAASTWTGSLDEIGIWNRALSLGEIQTLYSAGAGRFY